MLWTLIKGRQRLWGFPPRQDPRTGSEQRLERLALLVDKHPHSAAERCAGNQAPGFVKHIRLPPLILFERITPASFPPSSSFHPHPRLKGRYFGECKAILDAGYYRDFTKLAPSALNHVRQKCNVRRANHFRGSAPICAQPAPSPRAPPLRSRRIILPC